jgi:predicted ATPase/DNA-binding winged helix-turn-helix (wHTH) protein
LTTFAFGSFRLIRRSRKLVDGGRTLRIGARALDLLILLVERAGQTLTKDELLAEVWPDTVVDEANLRVHIGALRRALGEGSKGRFIERVPQVGYRFVPPVSEEPEDGPEIVASPHETRKSYTLPASLTRLIGRNETIRELTALLAERRFVTLVGPPGIGKSTVALAVAGHLADEYADGCRFVDLVALSDPKLVPSEIATLLDISPSGDSPARGLVSALKHKEMLLVLDNCEHLIAAVQELCEILLSASPGLAVLATSREPLRARGESVSALPPLSCPPAPLALKASDALAFSAVELFVERASASRDGFELTDTDAPTLADLCRQLEGIPLAIEIAAARVDAFNIRELAARLDDRFRLLMKGRRTALPRHQTLRGAMDWSYDTLSEKQQIVLCRLAVFPGSFDLAAASAVATDARISEPALADGVTELVAKSLVSIDPSGDPVRYRLLATTRAYGLEKLSERDELLELQHRHGRFTMQRVEQIVAQTARGAGSVRISEHVGLLDDIRSALSWSHGARGEPALAVALTVAAAPLGAWFSLHDEFRGYAARALDVAKRFLPADPRTEMMLTLILASLALHTQGSSDALFARVNELSEQIGEQTGRPSALEGVWASKFSAGDYPGALEVAERRARVTDGLSDPYAQRESDRLLGIALHFSGRQPDARPRLERTFQENRAPVSLRWFDIAKIDHRVSAGISLCRLLWLQGDWRAALAMSEEVLERAEKSSYGIAICYALGYASCPLAIWRGDRIGATRLTGKLAHESARFALRPWQSWARCFESVLDPQKPAPADATDVQSETIGTMRGEWVGADLLARVDSGFAGWCAPELLRARGENLLREGALVPEVETMFARSLDLARLQTARFWELRTATSMARMWRDHGEVTRARRLLEPLLARFGDEVGSLDLENARLLLLELS